MLIKELSSLQIAVDGHVATITLNRPEQLNAFDAVQHTELSETIDLIRNEGDVRAAILAANGRVFSAGGGFDFMEELMADPNSFTSFADQALPPRQRDDRSADPGRGRRARRRDGPRGDDRSSCAMQWWPLEKYACAIHTSWPASPPATVAASCGRRHSGMLRAKRHLLTGDPISAEDGYAIGLVTDLVEEPADALPAARALASRIAGYHRSRCRAPSGP